MNTDISLVDSLKTNAQFSSNKEFFKAYFEYLKQYCNSYVYKSEIKRIFRFSKKQEILKLDDSTYICKYTVNSTYYNSKKSKYLKLRIDKENRLSKSTFILNILLYPVEIIPDEWI